MESNSYQTLCLMNKTKNSDIGRKTIERVKDVWKTLK